MTATKLRPRPIKRANPYARAAASRAQWEMVVAVREQRRADVRDPERILTNFARWFLHRRVADKRAVT